MTAAPRHPPAVAHFAEVYRPVVNGVVASVDALRDALSAQGIDAPLVAPAFPGAADADDDGVVRVPSLPLPAAAGYRLALPLLGPAARARLAGAAIVHAHSPFVMGRLALRFARRRGLPLVWTYHTRYEEYAHYAPLVPPEALLALTRRFAARCGAVVAPTTAMAERLRAIGVGVPIVVAPSAIDVERFAAGRRSAAARALLGARGGDRLLLCVARLGREKRLGLALDALPLLPGCMLAIVGDGPERGALERRAAALGLAERVRFTGQLPPEALPDLYASSDVFVFPSPTETQGLVLAEAMAAGLPVVAVDAPVNREILGGHGRLAPADATAFAAAVAATSGRDPAAAAAARRRFAPQAAVAPVLEAYRRAAVCRTFGTPARDDAADGEGGR